MSKQKWLILLIPFSVLFFSEIFFLFNRTFYYALAAIIFVLIFGLRQLLKDKLKSLDRFQLSLLPIFFISSTIFYSTSLHLNWLKQLFIIAVIYLLFSYLKKVYEVSLERLSYLSSEFSSLFSLLSFLSVFFAAAFIFFSQGFLGLSIWWIFVFLLFIIWLSFSGQAWVGNMKQHASRLFVALPILLLFEIAVVLVFLPLNYNVSALLLAIIFYLMNGLIKFYLNRSLNAKIVKPYLIFGLIIILVILLTANWL
jgi:hypothetical protein